MSLQKHSIKNQKGIALITGLIALVILAVVAVGLSKALFVPERIKANSSAKVAITDFESLLIQQLGAKAKLSLLSSTSPCNLSFISQLNLPLGNMGSAQYLSSSLKKNLFSAIGEEVPNSGASSLGGNQLALNQALKNCPTPTPVLAASGSPGVYIFCLGFRGSSDFAFHGALGGFARIRLELGDRTQDSNSRVLGTPLSCSAFRAAAAQEIKIYYQIYLKKFKNDDNSIFIKSGTYFY
jgi:type II secretory pathway pseudopilin PulG